MPALSSPTANDGISTRCCEEQVVTLQLQYRDAFGRAYRDDRVAPAACDDENKAGSNDVLPPQQILFQQVFEALNCK